MNIEISLENTAKFFEFAKERLKLFNDFDFELQIHYFEELSARDVVYSQDLMALLDVVVFWELWLNNVNALKKYTAMVVEIACYANLLDRHNATAKIKEEL